MSEVQQGSANIKTNYHRQPVSRHPKEKVKLNVGSTSELVYGGSTLGRDESKMVCNGTPRWEEMYV